MKVFTPFFKDRFRDFRFATLAKFTHKHLDYYGTKCCLEFGWQGCVQMKVHPFTFSEPVFWAYAYFTSSGQSVFMRSFGQLYSLASLTSSFLLHIHELDPGRKAEVKDASRNELVRPLYHYKGVKRFQKWLRKYFRKLDIKKTNPSSLALLTESQCGETPNIHVTRGSSFCIPSSQANRRPEWLKVLQFSFQSL